DDFAYRLGISIQAIEVTDQKSGKVKGYLPCLKYYPNNPLNEESRLDHLTSNTLKENKCYELLAKELLYRIMRIKDIEKLLQLS
ncbi:MAG TPA: hypothetical protein DIU20_11220, partial [Cryomorphaceae bacterium]|nr:hypothetical protein [Cryomorphaceae bacterium]